jgi:hypothetical protein
MNKTVSTFPGSLGRLRRQERGVAAIAMALVSVGVAGAATVSFLLLRAQDAQIQDVSQAQVLTWADAAVKDFAVAHGRLPCPATSQNGAENCSGTGKGWLPVASLVNSTGPLPGLVGTQTTDVLASMGVRYLVAPNISSSATTFLPRLEDGEPLSGYGSPSETGLAAGVLPIEKTMETCDRLFVLQGWEDDGNQRWRIAHDGELPNALAPVTAQNMAYGVAVAARSAPKSASGINADFGDARMESPERARDVQYKDLVKITRHAALYDALGCSGAIASLDTMAVAQVWSGVNEGNREGVIRFANRVIDITELALAADTIGLGIQGAELANGLWNNRENAQRLFEAAASFLFVFIPIHVSGIVQATVGTVLTVIDLGISATAVGVDLLYINAYTEARDRLDAFTVWDGGRAMLEQAQLDGMSVSLEPSKSAYIYPVLPLPAQIGGSQ